VEKVAFSPPSGEPEAVVPAATGGGLAGRRWQVNEEEEAIVAPPAPVPARRLTRLLALPRWAHTMRRSPLFQTIFYAPPVAGERWVRPVIAYVLLAAILLVFVLEELAGGSTNPRVLIDFGVLNARMIGVGQVWRLLTAIFLHIRVPRLLLNVFALYVAGPEVEARYGYGRFAFLFFAAGLLGNALTFALYGERATAIAGADGAVYGLLGALLAYLLVTRQRAAGPQAPDAASRRLFVLIVVYIVAMGAAYGYMLIQPLGFVSGLVLGYLLAPRPQPDGSDAASLRRRWWVAAAVAAIIVAAVIVAFV
jgi:membrane associated rhomboid family serine protease